MRSIDKAILDRLIRSHYAPSDSMEWYDPKENQWYSVNYTPLRDPEEYCDDMEGYTPFGDE